MVTFRPVTEQDHLYLMICIAAEAYHRDWLQADFFYHPDAISVLGMDDGVPIVFLRMKPQSEETLSLFAQFCGQSERRVAKAMLEGFPTVRERAQAGGFKRIVIDTTSPLLAAFCQTRLNFRPMPETNHYVFDIE